MISVIIPTLNSQSSLVGTLSALIPATMDGLIREVIIADGGSSDHTREIAEDAGVRWLACPRASRGGQLKAGAEVARSPWLLFLHADTRLGSGWEKDAQRLIQAADHDRAQTKAGVFRLRLDDAGVAPRVLEKVVDWRTRIFKLPYGDQGLLVSRMLYDEVGGYRPIDLMEDVDFVRRIGGKRLIALDAKATTQPTRYREQGYVRRIMRNQICLMLYFLNVPPERLVRFYDPAFAIKSPPVNAR